MPYNTTVLYIYIYRERERESDRDRERYRYIGNIRKDRTIVMYTSLFPSHFIDCLVDFKCMTTFLSAGVVEYTDCTSAEGCLVSWGCRIHWLHLCREVRPPPPNECPGYMTLNNLMVRFQQCWSFGESGVPLHCHRSQVHSGPEW